MKLIEKQRVEGDEYQSSGGKPKVSIVDLGKRDSGSESVTRKGTKEQTNLESSRESGERRRTRAILGGGDEVSREDLANFRRAR